MKGRYITTKVLLACLSTNKHAMKDIHVQLKETIAEHKRIMRQFDNSSMEENDDFIMSGKQAA